MRIILGCGILICVLSCNQSNSNITIEKSESTYSYISNSQLCSNTPQVEMRDGVNHVFENDTLSQIENTRQLKSYDTFNYLIRSWGKDEQSHSMMTIVNIFHNSNDTSSLSILEVCTQNFEFGSCDEYIIWELNKSNNNYSLLVCHEVGGQYKVLLSKDSCIFKAQEGDAQINYYLKKVIF